MTDNKEGLKATFYGGPLASWLPFLLLVVSIFAMTVFKMMSLKKFLAIGYFALILGFFLLKEKKLFPDFVTEGIRHRFIAIIIPCFLFAGILSQVLQQSNLVNGLMLVSTSVGLKAEIIPIITFLISALISTCTGTSNGTVAAVTPIIFPIAMAMGCNPALILGAIISGGALGDNFSPISDTTVTVSSFYDVPVGPLVKDRVKYTTSAAVIAAVVFAAAGFFIEGSGVTTAIDVDAEHAKTLVMLLVPVLMIFLLIKNMELAPTLMLCSGAGLCLALAFGLLPWSCLLDEDGPVISGCMAMSPIIFFSCYICIFLEFVKASGAYEKLLQVFLRKCATMRSSELAVVAISIASVFMTSSNTLGIILTSPFGKEIYDKRKIDLLRGANVTSGIACAMAGLIPYCTAFILNYTLAAETGLIGDGFSLLSISMHSFFCIALFVVYAGCCVTGLWRTEQR